MTILFKEPANAPCDSVKMRHIFFSAGLFLLGCSDHPSTGTNPDLAGGGDGGLPMLGPVLEPGDPGASDVRLTVRADETLRPISPLIYGTNGTPSLATT